MLAGLELHTSQVHAHNPIVLELLAQRQYFLR